METGGPSFQQAKRQGHSSGNVPSGKAPDDKFVGQWNSLCKGMGFDDNCVAISQVLSETEPMNLSVQRSM